MADDLHTRIVAELDGRWDDDDAARARAALRAVVERHTPAYWPNANPTCKGCEREDGWFDWYPCPDIRLIADQLGLTEGDQRG